MILKQENIPDFVKTHLLPIFKTHTIITFTGPLGAGKTTIIREILRHLGVTSPITSPTFGYVKSYKNSHDQIFHHFDLYRINSLDAFMDAGFDEYITQKNSISFIEWPEIIAPILVLPYIKKNVINISIDYHPIDQMLRDVTIEIL